jgi:hypothetical protein
MDGLKVPVKSYTTQREIRVYDDESGDYLAVGMDGDGLGLVELWQTDSGRKVARFTMEPEHARLFAAAINEYLDREPSSEPSAETESA